MQVAALDAGSRVALPGYDEAYAEFARTGFAPEMYKLAMERTGIDYLVVYPTTGLLTTADPQLSAATAAAYRRAYNNWLHDFCSAAGGRVFTATDFSHPEGRRYAVAVKEMLELPGVSDVSKRKILWDNAVKLYPITPAAV
jgi:hypothetical protein